MAAKLPGSVVCELLQLHSRATLKEIKSKFDAYASFQKFQPSLDIIKANNRPDTTIYVRRKLEALSNVHTMQTENLLVVVGVSCKGS